MAFIPKGKAKSGPKKQFTDKGELHAVEFDKAESFAMQNAQRITEVGKSFAKSFVNFQKNFDKNTKDFAIQQKASFREREEELVKTFSDGPLAEGELLQSFEKLKQYMDDADVSIEKFTGRMESGGVELKKTFDSITDGLDEQEKKQRKLTQAGVATETKIIDGKVELVALNKDEIFKKQQLMHNLQKEIEADDKELKRLSKRNDLTQEQMDRQVELIDNIENNNEEIRDIQAQGVKKLKGDLGLFGQFGRVLSDGYNEFRSSFDEKVNAFFPAPLASIITGFVDSIQAIGGQLLDFAKPLIQSTKFLFKGLAKLDNLLGGHIQKTLKAFGKGIGKIVKGLKKFALGLLIPVLPFILIATAIGLVIAALILFNKEVRNMVDYITGFFKKTDKEKQEEKETLVTDDKDGADPGTNSKTRARAKSQLISEIKKSDKEGKYKGKNLSVMSLSQLQDIAREVGGDEKIINRADIDKKVTRSQNQEDNFLESSKVTFSKEEMKELGINQSQRSMRSILMDPDLAEKLKDNPQFKAFMEQKKEFDTQQDKLMKGEDISTKDLLNRSKAKKRAAESLKTIEERGDDNKVLKDDALSKGVFLDSVPTIFKQDNTSVNESHNLNASSAGPITEDTKDYYSKKAAGLMF